MPASPVVLSVPHAGRDYPEALLKASRLSLHQLETLEDRLVDRLVWRALGSGGVAIVAQAPRAEIDLNRDEREMDPAMLMPQPRERHHVPQPPSPPVLQSARSRGGLGLIPSRIGTSAIWRQPMVQAELLRRLDAIYRPYHAALDQALEEARSRFGVAILLDCHSMPPRTRAAPGDAGIVFGDRHGSSIAPDYLDAAVEAARQMGFRTALNVPYAGGYITTRHGRPADGIHALQMEIDRALYLAPDMRAPGKGFDKTAQLIAAVAAALAARALDPPQAIAAE